MRTKVWSALALSLIGSILGVHEARAQACVAWVAGGTYSPGEVVTYNGATYTSEVTQTDQVGSGCVPYRLCWESALFDACLAVGRACRVSKLGKGKPSGVRGSRDEPL